MDKSPAPRPGPPQWIRVLGFLGWLVLPIAATWWVVAFSDLWVLWWGPVWFGIAVVYTVLYFRWIKKRWPKPVDS